MTPIIQIAGLSFGYRQQPVLKGIDLSIEQGSTLGIIGPNGGGKTTLVKLMLGLLRPSAGTVSIAGMTPRDAVRRGDVIGYLPQSPQVMSTFPLTVRQVVRLGLAGKTGVLHRYAKSDVDFVESLIERFGLGDVAETPIGSLSGGQVQRTLVARAVAPRPRVLVLDEPTVGIDPGGQHRLIQFIQQLRDELGLTIVLVSHDLRAVSTSADRIACLNQTVHYHDVPERLPADVVYRTFSCDLQALGLHEHGPNCRHTHIGEAVEAGT